MVSNDGGLWTVVFEPHGTCTHDQVQSHGPEVLIRHVQGEIPLIDLRPAKTLQGLTTEVREAQLGPGRMALPTLEEFIIRARAAGAAIITLNHPPVHERPRTIRQAVAHDVQAMLPLQVEIPSKGSDPAPSGIAPNPPPPGSAAASIPTSVERRLELRQVEGGQWQYRVMNGAWEFGPYDRADAIAQARNRYGTDLVVTPDGPADPRLSSVEEKLAPVIPFEPNVG